MEVWIKPELIIDEMVLSQEYAANCRTPEYRYTIRCTWQGNQGQMKKKHGGNEIIEKTTQWGDYSPVDVDTTAELVNILNSLDTYNHNGNDHSVSLAGSEVQNNS